MNRHIEILTGWRDLEAKELAEAKRVSKQRWRGSFMRELKRHGAARRQENVDALNAAIKALEQQESGAGRKVVEKKQK